MSTITISQDGVAVLTIEGTIVPTAAHGSSAPTESGEPSGDYGLVLEAPGGHGHKFRPGITKFEVPAVPPGTVVEVSIVCNDGNVPVSLQDPSGEVVGDWNVPGIATVRSDALAGGDYSLTVNAPGYGEINHWRHP